MKIQLQQPVKLSRRDKARKKDNERIIRAWRKSKKGRKKVWKPELAISTFDKMIVRQLLLMGIVIKVARKGAVRYKAWVRGAPHHWVVAMTCASAYRKMFKKLEGLGIVLDRRKYQYAVSDWCERAA